MSSDYMVFQQVPKHIKLDNDDDKMVEADAATDLSLSNKRFVSVKVMNCSVYMVPEEYATDLEALGFGAFGIECRARNSRTNSLVALKKISGVFKNTVVSQKAYREILLLTRLVHDNIVSLVDIFLSPSNDLYLVREYIGADLHDLIQSQKITMEHITYFMYQLLRGLKYLHSANVVHFQLKPSNIWVDSDCNLKITNFGFYTDEGAVTETKGKNFAARYYLAPELLFKRKHWDEKVDIWSAGCIFGEMILRKPLFPGEDYLPQIDLIREFDGTPSDDLLLLQCNSEIALNYLRATQNQNEEGDATKTASSSSKKATLEEKLAPVLPEVPASVLDLMKKMLLFDTSARISAADALAHECLDPYHDTNDEPTYDNNTPLDGNYKDHTQEELKEMIEKEMEAFLSQQSVFIATSLSNSDSATATAGTLS